MSLLAEKSPFKSPRILDCFRLMSLEEMLCQDKVSSLTLVSADKALAKAVQQLCWNLDVNFYWKANSAAQRFPAGKSWIRRLPATLQALTYLRNLITRWPLRGCRPPAWHAGNGAVFIYSYFFNLAPDLAKKGIFRSRQWESLPEYLIENGASINFLHHFLKSPDVPNARTALEWTELFNRGSAKQARHAFLDSYLSWELLCRAAFRWLKLRWIVFRLGAVDRHFTPKGSKVSMWPLLREDWQSSVQGKAAIENLVWIELFNDVMKKLPHQKLGLYLCENQGWERALIDRWRKYGHGTLIGVPHSTVRFWHLSYFSDPQTLADTSPGKIPLPDRFALNGKMAWDAFIDSGYRVELLVETEALRYQYLNRLGTAKGQPEAGHPARRLSSPGRGPKKILVLGDFTVAQTMKMLECASQAILLLDVEVLLTLKPHPVCQLSPVEFSGVAVELTNKPLAEILHGHDVAFSSNSTSAGLDAYLAGLPVIVFLDEHDFNFSPLKGVRGVSFVSTPRELASELEHGDRDESQMSRGEFFWLDENMPRWRKILSEAGVVQ